MLRNVMRGAHLITLLIIASVTASVAASIASAATFGNIVPIRGQVSDIVVDTSRHVLYAANFTANRVEVLSLDSQSLLTPINVAAQPSAVAISPDHHYLVVGHYNALPTTTGITIVNLESGTQQTVSLGADSVLAAVFGNSHAALIVTTTGVRLLEPSNGTLSSAVLTDSASTPLQVPWASYPAAVISGSAGVSGDGNVLYAFIDQPGTGSNTSSLIRYSVIDGSLVLVNSASSPALGPRVASVDQTGSTVLTGWALLFLSNTKLANIAQFPYAAGLLDQGGHAFDPARNLIYGQIGVGTTQAGAPANPSKQPLFQIFDSDNLTVRETFPLKENLAGKALVSGNYMYGISDSGITVFPVGALSTVHRVKALQEDLLFQSNGCNQGVLTQDLDIVDPGGNTTDFTLVSPSPGVTFSVNSGVTPASVRVFVDPAVFQDEKGTASVPVQITTSGGVNLPAPVRILINTRNPDQRGTIYDVPGTIVDVLADPVRDRFYLLRQDQNQVLVFDGTSLQQIATLRTGNTPVQMAIYQDFLLVTNDNSQLVNVFNIASLTPADPIYFPGGYYPRSIAAANFSVLTTSRSATSDPPHIFTLDVLSRIANQASTSIYKNSIDQGSVLATSPSGGTIFLAQPDGNVALYDTAARVFVASRSDLGAVSGAYAALSDNTYVVGNNVLNTALVPVGQIDLLGGVSSGIAVVDDKGLASATPATSRSGIIHRFSLDQFSTIAPARTAEAPDLAATVTRTPVGQTGQTILPFTRTLAPLSNHQTIVQLSTSGFTAVPWDFDAATQPPVISAVTNAADQTAGIAPGGLVTVWGSGMSVGNAAASTLPLSNGLNNVCLYANGAPAPLLFVSPNQINAQLPFSTPGGASLVLSNPNGTSVPFGISVTPSAPAIFRNTDGTPLIVRTVDGKLITNDTPIHLNQVLNIYMTGLGAVNPSVASGAAGPGGPLAATTTTPAVYIGGSQLFTLWSGLAPGLVGVYQVNAQVPFHNVPTGSNIPFTVVQGSAQTTVKLKVEQ